MLGVTMDFVQQVEKWVQAEVFHGKVMVAVGGIVVALIPLVLSSKLPMLEGTGVPLALIACAFVGYGAVLIVQKPALLKKVKEKFHTSPAQARAGQLEKGNKDNQTYSLLLKLYPLLAVLSGGAFFVFSDAYYEGVCLGLITLFMSTYILDTVLQNRLNNYLAAISK